MTKVTNPSRFCLSRCNVSVVIIVIQLILYCSKANHCHGLIVLPGWNHALSSTSSLDHTMISKRIQDENIPTVTKALNLGKDYQKDKLLSPLLSWTKVSSSLTTSLSYVSSSSNIVISADNVDSKDFLEVSTNANQEESETIHLDKFFDENVLENQLSSLKSMRLVQTDEVVRVVDGNTVQLANNGFVTLAAVQSSSFYNNNEGCMSTYPSTKLKQLLPPRRKVQFINVVEENNKKRSLLFSKKVSKSNEEKTILVNAELIRTGMGKPTIRGQAQAEKLLPGITHYFDYLHEEAKLQKVGMYQSCELDTSLTSFAKKASGDTEYDFDSQFEPMELAVETQWGDDGGKQILKSNKKVDNQSLSNPGDTKQCYDFKTFEDALQWYERYLPLYGDVAQLDKDGDGIPCSGLPHTTNSERYRIKKKVILNNN